MAQSIEIQYRFSHGLKLKDGAELSLQCWWSTPQAARDADAADGCIELALQIGMGRDADVIKFDSVLSEGNLPQLHETPDLWESLRRTIVDEDINFVEAYCKTCVSSLTRLRHVEFVPREMGVYAYLQIGYEYFTADIAKEFAEKYFDQSDVDFEAAVNAA